MAEVPDWGLDEIRDHGTRAEGPDMAADAAADPAAHNPLFAAPMQLCRPSACHTFLEAVPETLQALRDVSSPVVVVAGVGSQRIGKSTILNLLHSRRTSGFGLGHTLDAQTAGIWVWMRKHPKDPSVCVCFADTEGLDTPHIQQSYNWMLSSLTLLISSVFLYQSKSTIDSSATERLSTILAVAEQMLGQDNGGTSATTKPYFVWVLRDMQLQMHNDPKTEMMEKLETGHIRKMKRSFKEFDCFPLPRPVDTEEGLQEVCMQASIYVPAHVCMHACMLACVRACLCLRVCVWGVRVNTRARIGGVSVHVRAYMLVRYARTYILTQYMSGGTGIHGVEIEQVETMKFEALKKNFQEDFFLFDRFVFKLAATAPMCGSSAVTGPVLSELVGRYIDAIRDRKGLLSSITELPSQAQLIAKMAAEKALKDGKASYNQALDGLMSRLPLSLFDVYQEHRLALSSAEKTMVEAAVGVEESDMQELYGKLRAYALDEQPAITLSPNAAGFTAERQVRGRFLPVLEANEKLAHEASHKLWQGAYAHVAAGVLATPCAFSSIKEYDDAVAACKQSVLEEANVGGGRAALERYLASSKQLTSDRETVTHKLFACQLAAVQEEARKQVARVHARTRTHTHSLYLFLSLSLSLSLSLPLSLSHAHLRARTRIVCEARQCAAAAMHWLLGRWSHVCLSVCVFTHTGGGDGRGFQEPPFTRAAGAGGGDGKGERGACGAARSAAARDCGCAAPGARPTSGAP